MSKLYPAVAPRARHLGRAQQRHDTLRDALMDPLTRITRREKNNSANSDNSCQKPEDLWALKDVSFEACPERSEGTGLGRNSAGKSTLLKILSRITEPADGRFAIPTKGVFCA